MRRAVLPHPDTSRPHTACQYLRTTNFPARADDPVVPFLATIPEAALDDLKLRLSMVR